MGRFWAIGVGFVALLLAGCSGIKDIGFVPVDAGKIASQINVVRYDVLVPRDLTTSEAHQYYPLVDIVWREDPPGDRHAQVEQLVRNALGWGLAAFNKGQDVVVSAQVTKFHALSQKARYSVGGVHTLRFILTVSDAKTGGTIAGPLYVNADLRALGGARAVAAEAQGWTQKARITQHLAGTVQQVLLQNGLGQAIGAPVADDR